MKKLLSLLSMAAVMAFAISCGDDDEPTPAPTPDPTFDAPTASTSSAIIEVDASAEGSATFTVSVDADLTGNWSATGTNVTVANASGTVDGTSVTVNFTAADEAGAASVTLTVTDSENQSASATAVISIAGADVVVPVPTPVVDVFASAEGTGTTTWTKDNIYVLRGFVFVNEGQTLTIEPGTIIKGQPGEGAGASALIVARGGSINAVGTATEPIIFTALTDELDVTDIAAGNFGSPNLTPTQAGRWGGLIVLGSATISAANDNDEDVSEVQIEGIPASETRGLYGGTDDADDSGDIAYISIRHGGSLIGAGNEINGLTLGGVGSGTSISNVEVVANEDDGVEWFGGNVDITNLLVWNSGDDAVDTDQDWIGTLDNFVVVTPQGGSAFELDGPEGSINRGCHTIINGTVYAGDNVDHLVDWDGSTNAGLESIYFYGWAVAYPPAGFDAIESFGGDGNCTTNGWEYTLTEAGMPVDSVFKGVPSLVLTEVAQNANTGGADASVFGWTWASQSGSLAAIGLE